MEVYSKTSSILASEEVKEPCEVQVKSGKKIRVCISQALKLLQTTKEKVLISGSGPTVTKAITTAEIVKRKVKGLHQQNNLFYSKIEDLWEPKKEGLDRLKVTRNVPSISILLSYQPLDNKAPGYQAPGVSQPLTQFREEDIELADEKFEGKNSLRQSPSQHHRRGKGVRNNRKQRTKPHEKQQQQRQQQSETEKESRVSRDNENAKTSPYRETRRKRGLHHGGQQPSKRPHSDKEKTGKTESPKPEKSRTSKTSP